MAAVGQYYDMDSNGRCHLRINNGDGATPSTRMYATMIAKKAHKTTRAANQNRNIELSAACQASSSDRSNELLWVGADGADEADELPASDSGETGDLASR